MAPGVLYVLMHARVCVCVCVTRVHVVVVVVVVVVVRMYVEVCRVWCRRRGVGFKLASSRENEEQQKI